MIGEVLKDRFGQEIKLGTKVIFAEYARNSDLYIGKVVRMTPKKVIVAYSLQGSWERHVPKKIVDVSLISAERLSKLKES